jgi:hypothetical protein
MKPMNIYYDKIPMLTGELSVVDEFSENNFEIPK